MASPVLSVSTPPTSVSLASHGEEQPPTITYTNVKELHQVVRQVPGDFLMVQSKYIYLFSSGNYEASRVHVGSQRQRVLAGALKGLWSRYSCIEASALSAGGVGASVRRLEHPCQRTLVGTHALLTTLAAYHVQFRWNA